MPSLYSGTLSQKLSFIKALTQCYSLELQFNPALYLKLKLKNN